MTVLGYPSAPQRCRLDQAGEGVRTGPEPGRDNAGLIEDAFKLARPGDVIVGAVDHDGDPSWLPQCTFLDRRIRTKIPTGVQTSGPNECPTAQAYVRRYHAQDWRESVFGMESGSVLSNCIIYLADGYAAGYPFGIVSAEDEFIISPRIINCQATIWGNAMWSGILSLDGTAGNYGKGGRGIRDFRVHDVIGWGYEYRGLHVAGGVAGVIDGYCQTRMTDKAGVLDIYVGGRAATPDNATGPGYKIQIAGPQLGSSAYLEHADRILIDSSDIDSLTLAGNVTNSEIRSRVSVAVSATGAGNISNRINGVAG
jgi:hypothetical protein